MLRALCIALASVFLVPALSSAQNPLIAEGETMVDELRYEEALQTLSAALIRSGNSEQERARIYQLLARTYLTLNRSEEATGAYRSLLVLLPDHVPSSDLSPRFRDFFTGVRAQWESEGRPGVATAPPAPVSIRHASPAQTDPEIAVLLTAELDDPDRRVASLVLAYRRGTSDVFQRVDCAPTESGYEATIPAEDVGAPLVEYYFEAIGADGLPIAGRGDVAAPLRIDVEEEGSIASKWWFWTIIGAVVVGTAVGVGVAVSGDGNSQGTLVVNVE